MSSLRDLELLSREGNPVQGSVHSFFRSLSCDTLRSMTLQNLSFKSVIDFTDVLRNCSALNTLRIVDQWTRGTDRLVDIVLLRALQGRVCHDPVDSLDISPQRYEPILPSLEALTVIAYGKSYGIPSDDSKLTKVCVDIVLSRWSPLVQDDGSGPGSDLGSVDEVVSLRSLSLSLTHRKIDREQLQPLIHLAAAGLELSVVDSEGVVF